MRVQNSRTGVLLLNVGTPDAPEPGAVRRYLREFLGDPGVLDMSPLARTLLLHLVILPFRPRRSAEAYRAIWRPDGSPLLVHTTEMASRLGGALGESFEVAVAMRYGNPSIASALDSLRTRGVGRWVAFPLFPQQASSTTGTALQAVHRLAASAGIVPAPSVVPPFYADPGFREAWRQVGSPVLADVRPDHVLFSFHGLPESHVRKADPTGRICLSSPACCNRLGPENRGCYRAQCHETARLLAGALSLERGSWSLSFQSRLGRTPWIRPYTDDRIRELAGAGVRRLAVFCPAFVADCLETLEEIGLRAREQFRSLGGEDLVLAPSLNAHPAWIEAAAALVRNAV